MAKLWIESIARDMVHGFRVLRKRPSLSVSAVLVLALTVTATISLTSLVDRLLLKPLPIAHPDRLVQVTQPTLSGDPPWEQLRGTLIEQLRPQLNRFGTPLTIGYPFDEFVSYSSKGFQPEVVRTHPVDVAAFETLGIRVRIGRAFESGDAQPGSEPVAVLSHEYW